jgi:hypothetical protein
MLDVLPETRGKVVQANDDIPAFYEQVTQV